MSQGHIVKRGHSRECGLVVLGWIICVHYLLYRLCWDVETPGKMGIGVMTLLTVDEQHWIREGLIHRMRGGLSPRS